MGAVCGAVQQGGGVGLPFLRLHEPDHPLVAGHLNVPAEQNVADPHQGVEPVQRQGDVAQHFDPVIPLLQVGALMGQDVAPLLPGHPHGNIDFRLHEPQNEGGFDALALPAAGDFHRQADFPLQVYVADQTVNSKARRHSQPDPGDQRFPVEGCLCRRSRGRFHGNRDGLRHRRGGNGKGGLRRSFPIVPYRLLRLPQVGRLLPPDGGHLYGFRLEAQAALKLKGHQ